MEESAQRDDERERRRMRDRQRRQSMTVEQRERHLARRRRNYQIRRLRAETCYPQIGIVLPQQFGFESGGEIIVNTENQGLISAPEDLEDRNYGFDSVGVEKIDFECLQSVEQETLGVKTPRLSRVRCLARLVNISRAVVEGNHENVAEVSTMSCDEATRRLAGRVRLSHFKRLARRLDVAFDETRDRARQDLTQEVVSFGKPTSEELTIEKEENNSAV